MPTKRAASTNRPSWIRSMGKKPATIMARVTWIILSFVRFRVAENVQ